jgi:hypothetical protein
MLYAIFSQDIEDSLDKRMSVRDAHVERLNILKNAGRLVLAGPHPAIDNNEPGQAGFTGSLVVAEFDNIEDAQLWADADPYIKSGAYANVVVKPFKKVLP